MEKQRLTQSKTTANKDHRQPTNRLEEHPFLQLQADIGNAATNRLIQAQSQDTAQPIREKPLFGGLSRDLLPIQTKLTVGAIGDKYEQEADRNAAQIVNQINKPEVGQSLSSSAIEQDKLSRKPTVQPSSERSGMGVTPNIEASIQKARGSGQSLPDNIRGRMEQAFGANFSGVRIHVGAQSDELNQIIRAKAFTTGQDIFFRQGNFNPDNSKGQELLAHELTHVVQQNGASLEHHHLDSGNHQKIQSTSNNVIQRQYSQAEEKIFLAAARSGNWQLVPAQYRQEFEDRITPLLDPNDVNQWQYSSNLFDQKTKRNDQFNSDAALWYHTMFDQGQGIAPQDERVLQEQQGFLKRHFLAMSIMGMQMGDQANQQSYVPVDQAPGMANIPLAALASHGGRVGFESATQNLGTQFANLLLTGDKTMDETAMKIDAPTRGHGFGWLLKGTGERPANATNTSQAFGGAHYRISTHPQNYKQGRGWKEKKTAVKGKGSKLSSEKGIGMNLAFGGHGNMGPQAVIGPEGAWGQGGIKQHGHAYIGKATHSTGGARLQVGFEGAGANAENQIGGGHNAQTAQHGNERSLTGQSKAKNIGLEGPNKGRGAFKANVTDTKLNLFEQSSHKLRAISQINPDMEKTFMRRILMSTNQTQRDNIAQEIIDYQGNNNKEHIKYISAVVYDKIQEKMKLFPIPEQDEVDDEEWK